MLYNEYKGYIIVIHMPYSFFVALFSKRAYSYLGPLHHTLTHREEQVGAGGG